MAAKHKTNATPTVAAVDSLEFRAQGALNIIQAAAYCGVRCSAIEDVVRDGRLIGRRLGRNVIILKADLARISHQELATALKRGGFDWFTAR
jgi:hypothetical protein